MGRLSWWAPCNHIGHCKWEAKGSKPEKGRMTMAAEVAVMCSEDGRRGHEERNMGGPYKPEKAGKGSHLELPEGMQHCLHLAFNPVGPILDFSDFQNCKMINLCFF